MHLIDYSQAVNGALFSFAAGLVISGFNPFPLAIATGLAATISSISTDIFSKKASEKKLSISTDILFITGACTAFFSLFGVIAFLSFEGIAGMAFGGFVFSLWIIIRKWSELYNKLN